MWILRKLLYPLIICCYIMPLQIVECDSWLDYFESDGQAHLGFIVIVRSEYKVNGKREMIVRHEKVHIEQQKEVGIIPFYIFYPANMLLQIYRYGDEDKAYENNMFEKEAYKAEKELDYRRKMYECWR